MRTARQSAVSHASNGKRCYGKYVREMAAAVQRLYGPRLVSLVLYGSVARGDHRPDSDVDVLIVAGDLPRGWGARKKEFLPVATELSAFAAEFEEAGYFPHLSFRIYSPDEATRTRPLYLDMTQDARLLFDRDRFFSNVLRRLRRRMKELGSERIYVGDRWYWDLKPGMKFGEVVEL